MFVNVKKKTRVHVYNVIGRIALHLFMLDAVSKEVLSSLGTDSKVMVMNKAMKDSFFVQNMNKLVLRH